MTRQAGWMAALTLVLIAACSSPISDPRKLGAIRVEATSLMADHPIKTQRDEIDIPKEQWPKAIASLHPQSVVIRQSGVSILMKPYFDGGWGYDVPRDASTLPMPTKCYSEVSHGIFWHDPC
ncbi:hypothetical protein [Sphingobium sp. CAP-1]|uniref:hypothetical protein n=1 Tax=Sphingobium sp. CAP-1 TaxID=2676077 RepID=UPI0012BB472D|nr:hypothetical protein [Sphingobium sp. CAP-1]QGP78145.1 hypothetical protein GL174_03405 [Sphingobium sp. CAP-1]